MITALTMGMLDSRDEEIPSLLLELRLRSVREGRLDIREDDP